MTGRPATPRSTGRLLVMVAVLLLSLTACSGGGDVATTDATTDVGAATESASPAEAAGGSGAEVEVVDFDFVLPSQPMAGEFTVVNKGDLPHTFTAEDGTFDTGTVTAGSQTTVMVPAGTYDYVCTIHPSQMSGTVTVEG